MNDKKINQFIIQYKYYEYSHSYFHNNSYKLVDKLHPHFDFEKYYIIQRLYHSDNNVKLFKTFIINNIFLKKTQRNIQTIIFIDIQRIKRALKYFIFICKYKIKKVFNYTNLCYDALKKNAIFLLEDNIKYGFDLFEIKKIVQNSFNYLDIDFPYIINMKNPYTNKPFKLSNLYNIYFYLYQNISLPLMFQCFFKHNFNKDLTSKIFSVNHYVECYKNKYNSVNDSIKVNIIKRMLQVNRYYNLKYLPYKILIKYFKNIGMNYFIYENLYLNEFNQDVIKYYKTLYKKPLIKIYLKNVNYNKKTRIILLDNTTTVVVNRTFNYL